MVAGTNTLGILQEARTAWPALPLIKSALRPLSKRVATAAKRMGNCSMGLLPTFLFT